MKILDCGRKGLLVVGLGLLMSLAACGGTGSEVGDASGESSGTTAVSDIVIVDTGQMPDEACHAMDGTIMGDCSQADIEAQILEMGILTVDTEMMADADCHVMEGVIMGDCSEEDISRLIDENVIIVDRQSMADEACHAMDNVIMGQCSDADIERLAEEIRAGR